MSMIAASKARLTLSGLTRDGDAVLVDRDALAQAEQAAARGGAVVADDDADLALAVVDADARARRARPWRGARG
jgi:hypothetical protein